MFLVIFYDLERWSQTGSQNPDTRLLLSSSLLPLLLLQGKPVEILPFLYLGSAYHASRDDYLGDLDISALLNVSRRDLQPAKGHYHYKWIPVEDNHMADISSHFQEAIHFIGESHLQCNLYRGGIVGAILYLFLILIN